MDSNEEWKAPYNFSKPPDVKNHIILRIIAAAAIIGIIVFFIFAISSNLKQNKQNTVQNGYSSFEYNKRLKADLKQSNEVIINGDSYFLTNNFNPDYVIENRGAYNEYGFFFGNDMNKPDLFMMKYDKTEMEFWFSHQYFSYPDVSHSQVKELIIPNGFGAVKYGTNPVRISFGDSPVKITDSSVIGEAVEKYGKTDFIYKTDAVPAGTTVYAKFEDSILFLKIGTTAEE